VPYELHRQLFRYQVSAHEVCGGPSGNGTSFAQSTWVLPSLLRVVTVFTAIFYCFMCIVLWIFLVFTVSACEERAATLTKVFPCFFLGCKTNSRV
jgi:hypothetical protein